MSARRRKTPQHWLTRPKTIRRLWLVFIVVLALTVLPDAFRHPHAAFGIDGSFGFGAWFGFGTCLAMMVIAKLLGVLLRRPDDYYDR